jgi:alkylation response protein AidB-like acyl-CoA dehydrogenase
MDARLTEEQRLIQATAEQLARDLEMQAPASLAGEAARSGWLRMAEAGFLGMRVPESAGGSPTSSVEVALVAEQLGRFLVPLPFLGSAVCASELLRRARASDEIQAKLSHGELRLAPVLDRSLGRWCRPGEAGIAWDCAGASAGLRLDAQGARVEAVELGAPLESQDLTRQLRAIPADAKRVDLGDLGGAIASVEQTRALALVMAALAADLVGVMQGALERAVGYIKAREQFGVKVGSFQALQHIAAESLVSTEGARGFAWYGSWAAEALEPDEGLVAARSAKAYASERARDVCETAIQLHGGIGMTWESPCHVFLRRALLGRQCFGDERVQLRAISEVRHGPWSGGMAE